MLALNEDGTRNPYLPNLTNPEAAAIAGGIIKDYLRKNPAANSYGFAPDDGMPRDFNPETLKLSRGFVTLGARPGVPGEASITEEWLMFVNRVADEVHKEFPQAYIATNGYANRNLPPEGVKLDDRMVIMFAAIWSCTLHGYDDEHCWQKVRQGQMLKRWCELCKNVWIYGYNYNMLVSGLTPVPEFTKLRRDFPLMKKWGVMGFHDESRNVWAEAGIASRYLRAQLEWNAEADVDAVLDDFFARWYGRAARPMKAFYVALDDAVTRTPIHAHEDRVLPEVYTPELLERLKQLVAEAEQLADTEPRPAPRAGRAADLRAPGGLHGPGGGRGGRQLRRGHRPGRQDARAARAVARRQPVLHLARRKGLPYGRLVLDDHRSQAILPVAAGQDHRQDGHAGGHGAPAGRVSHRSARGRHLCRLAAARAGRKRLDAGRHHAAILSAGLRRLARLPVPRPCLVSAEARRAGGRARQEDHALRPGGGDRGVVLGERQLRGPSAVPGGLCPAGRDGARRDAVRPSGPEQRDRYSRRYELVGGPGGRRDAVAGAAVRSEIATFRQTIHAWHWGGHVK